MATISDSIDQLTASLRELSTKPQPYCKPLATEATPKGTSEIQGLIVPSEIQAFLEEASRYAEKTRTISVGKY